MGNPVEPIHLEGEDAEDLRRVLRSLEEELGPRHRNEAGLIFSILADLPADLGVWRREPPIQPVATCWVAGCGAPATAKEPGSGKLTMCAGCAEGLELA